MTKKEITTHLLAAMIRSPYYSITVTEPDVVEDSAGTHVKTASNEYILFNSQKHQGRKRFKVPNPEKIFAREAVSMAEVVDAIE